MPDAVLFPLGLAIGTYSVMVGSGGGFLLVPILMQLYPDPPAVITSISLSSGFLSSLSGVLVYRRQQRIDYVTAGLFALGAFPGAALGATLTRYVPTEMFRAAFGLLLSSLAVMLFRQRDKSLPEEGISGLLYRRIADSAGVVYEYRYNPCWAVVLTLGTATVATLFGLGGGAILVPLAVRFLRIPAHVAVATVSLVVVVSTGSGVLVHLGAGHVQANLVRIGFLAAGTVLGGQIGARLSRRVSSRALVRILAVGLLFLGGRLIWSAFRG